MTSLLRASIATKAVIDVNNPGSKPKSKNDNTIGIPVKSNLRNGSAGKGIFRFEYLSV
jgi:hypothetical protein